MTTPDSRRQKVQDLIRELQVQAQPGEQPVSDEDYIKWLDYLYRRYVEASGYKSGIKGKALSLIGQADYDEDLHKQFAFAMMGSVGNNPADMPIRDWVTDRFGEDTFADYGEPAPVSAKSMPPEEVELMDYGDAFTAKDVKADLPDMLDPEFAKNASTYNAGKNMMTDYWRDKSAWYRSLGSSQKAMADRSESRLSSQYDIEKTIGSYNKPYINYLQDFSKGKVKEWNNDMWGAALSSISNNKGFKNMINADPNIVKELSRMGTEENVSIQELKDNLNLANSIISDYNDVVGWIVGKESSKWGGGRQMYQSYENILRTDLRNFMMENMGKDMNMLSGPNAVPGTGAVIGRKLFNEWKDRGFNWTERKSEAQKFQEEKMLNQGFKLEPAGRQP